MGTWSIWHWLVVLLIVLLVFGTKKLRNIGADLGGAVRGFKDGMKESSADKHSESGSSPQSQLGGRTIEGEVKDVKADINREIELEELRKFKTTFEDAARGFEGTVNATVDSVQSEVSKTETELNELTKIEGAPAPSGTPQPAPAEAAPQPGEVGREPQGGGPPPPEKTSV